MGQDTCDGTRPTKYAIVTRQGKEIVDAEVIHEQWFTISVNGQDLVTVMCTPCHQEALALGFLANEGVIQSMDDVGAIHICAGGTCADVWLSKTDFKPPHRMLLTSGCGGGVTFDDLNARRPPLTSDLRITPDRLWDLMEQLHQAAELYPRSRGVHTSALSDGESVLITAEDVGRHNTLDKLRGQALQLGMTTHGKIILTTGRISSEMINKGHQMEIPLVCSQTSPTSLSTQLAEAWNMTLVGYLRPNSMRLYTHPERVSED